MFAGTRCEDIDVADIRETRGDIGSRRRQTGILLPSSSHSPSALGEYPRKCNLPSIQPLISKELLEPVSMYIYIYIFLSAMDALSGTRRGGEADVAARLAKDSRIRQRLEKSTLARSDPRLPNLRGYICIYIYIFSNGDEIEKSRKEWIHLGPRARNLFIRISLPRPIKGCVFEIVIRRFSPKSPGTCKSFRACERKEIAGTIDIPVSRILLERGGKGKRRSSNSKNRESLEMIKRTNLMGPLSFASRFISSFRRL